MYVWGVECCCDVPEVGIARPVFHRQAFQSNYSMKSSGDLSGTYVFPPSPMVVPAIDNPDKASFI